MSFLTQSIQQPLYPLNLFSQPQKAKEPKTETLIHTENNLLAQPKPNIQHFTLAEPTPPTETKTSSPTAWFIVAGISLAGVVSLVIWHKPIQQWFSKTFHTPPKPIEAPPPPNNVSRNPEEIVAEIKIQHKKLMAQFNANTEFPQQTALLLTHAINIAVKQVGSQQWQLLPPAVQAELTHNLEQLMTKQLESNRAFNKPLLGESVENHSVQKGLYVAALMRKETLQAALKTEKPQSQLGGEPQVRLVDLAELVYEQECKMISQKEIQTSNKKMTIKATKMAKNHIEIQDPAQRNRALTAALVYADLLETTQSNTLTESKKKAHSQVQAFVAGQEIHLPDPPAAGTTTP